MLCGRGVDGARLGKADGARLGDRGLDGGQQIRVRVDAGEFRRFIERMEERGDLRAAQRLRAVVILAPDVGPAGPRSMVLLSTGMRGSSTKRVSPVQRSTM